MSAVNEQIIDYVARLARIELEQEELKTLSGQIKGILDFIGKLEEADTGNIDPASHILPVENVFRQDQPQISLNAQEAVFGAPKRQGNFFSVPKVID